MRRLLLALLQPAAWQLVQRQGTLQMRQVPLHHVTAAAASSHSAAAPSCRCSLQRRVQALAWASAMQRQPKELLPSSSLLLPLLLALARALARAQV